MDEATGHALPPTEALPCAVAILDRRPEFARLIEVLVRERRPAVEVRAFDAEAIEAAREWVAVSEGAVVVLADADAAGGALADRAATWSSRAGQVTVVVMVGPDGVADCPHAVVSKPGHLDAWRASLDVILGAAGAWHTAPQWRTPPGPTS